MSRIGTLPIAVPAGRRRDYRRPETSRSRAPRAAPARAPSEMASPARTARSSSRARASEDAQAAPRPDPDAREQHGRRGDTGYRKGSRSPASAIVPRCRAQAAAEPGLQPPDRDRSAGGHQLRGGEPDQARRRRHRQGARRPDRRRVRATRKPEPYKGKGVRYAGEQIRRKAGKAGKTAARSKPPKERTTMTAGRQPRRRPQKRHDRLRLRVEGTARGRAWPCSAA